MPQRQDALTHAQHPSHIPLFAETVKVLKQRVDQLETCKHKQFVPITFRATGTQCLGVVNHNGLRFKSTKCGFFTALGAYSFDSEVVWWDIRVVASQHHTLHIGVAAEADEKGGNPTWTVCTGSGRLYQGREKLTACLELVQVGDIVRVVLDLNRRAVFFAVNGRRHAKAHWKLPEGPIYPFLASFRDGEVCDVIGSGTGDPFPEFWKRDREALPDLEAGHQSKKKKKNKRKVRKHTGWGPWIQHEAEEEEEAAAAAAAAAAGEKEEVAGANQASEVPDDVDAASSDATGLDLEEIRVVMSQASCTREAAIEALRNNENIVDAILALT